jgi:asparagine synthase (glutamine-hydrolysing)
LAGDGGDELFAGNARYANETARERYFRILQGLPSVVIGVPLALLGSGRMAMRARRRFALLTTPLPDRMLASEHVAPEDARDMFTTAFLREIDPEVPMALGRETYRRTSSPAALHRMMHMDLRITLADNDLRKVGAMCRMAGMRVRFPFLDEDVAAFAAKIPVDLLLKEGELRAFYKLAMRGFLPQEVIEKKKHGFGMPYDVWIHEDRRIRVIATDAAHSFKRRGICEAAHIDALLQRSGEGDGRAASHLWDLMMLELWLQAHGTSP